MFTKPFRSEETATNCIDIFDDDGTPICQILNDDDEITEYNRKTAELIVAALNVVTDELLADMR